jgi:hypothetical protein
MFKSLKNGMMLEFRYTNWKGEIEDRRVLYHQTQFGMIKDFHPEPCFVLQCFCLQRNATRSFDVSRIDASTFKVI